MAYEICIYTDGACSGNPGKGGYGVVMELVGTNYRKEFYEGFKLTTNNRMELLAVIVGLEKVNQHNKKVLIVSHSKYVVDLIIQSFFMKNVVIIDNYDSFTYNLVHLINEIIEGEVTVLRNGQFDIKAIEAFDYIILSPGPGLPEEAGLLKDVIRKYGTTKKIFGVCLGLQAIGEVFGGQSKNLSKVFHGMKTIMKQTENKDPIFEGINQSFEAGRYHSWVINKDSCPQALLITAVDEDGEIMAARHKDLDIYGVQFHPESIMTPDGRKMLTNFLNL